MLATEISIEITLRDFGARRDIERAGAGIAVFHECLKRGPENAFAHRGLGCGRLRDHGFLFRWRRHSPCSGTTPYHMVGVPMGTRQLRPEARMSIRSSRSAGGDIPGTLGRHREAAKTDRTPTPREAWLTVGLLFLFMVVNFADKAVIGIAAVPIMEELQLSPRQFGLLGSSFYLLFAVSAIATGFIVNRVQTRWALLVMGLVWALTQFPMLGAVGFATLMACRIALGAGEGPAYPVALHSTYKWFPNELRTLPTAVIAQGGGIGILVALPLLNWVIVNYSWHWAFGVLGLAGLAWTAAWLVLGREGSLTGAAATQALPAPDRIAYGQLLLSPTIIACWCASFGAQWGLSLALSWQGAFLIKGLGFAQGSIGLLGGLPAGGPVILVIGAGWGFQGLLACGVSSRVARGIFGGACVALGGAALAIMP